MATLMDKVRRYIQSPEGRRNVEKAKEMARDPRNRRKLSGLLDKFRSRGHR